MFKSSTAKKKNQTQEEQFDLSGLNQHSSSPTQNQARIDELNRVLQGMASNLKDDKQNKRDLYFQRVKQIEDRIQKNEMNDNQKFRLLSEQLEKGDEQITIERDQRILIGEKCSKQLSLIEKNFTIQLNEEYQSRKANEQEIFNEIDEKIGQMKNQIQDHSSQRIDYEQNQITAIEKEIEELRYYFEQEKAVRDDHAEKLIRKFGEDILRLQEFFSDEKKLSEESYDTTMRLLQDLDLSIQNDLDSEIRIRDKQEKAMLKLLEETCQKIESSLLND